MSKSKIVCAGHLCLDIIPDLSPVKTAEGESFIIPGRLIRVGAASIALGGAVSPAWGWKRSSWAKSATT